MIHKIIPYFFILLLCLTARAQTSMANLLEVHNEHQVPYISVQELAMPKTEAVILDARELNEFEVSHIKNAIHVGYNNFKVENILNRLTDKGQNIVVYCSIGIRSEDIAAKLIEAGYRNVRNLYGGIFEWKNNGFSVYSPEGVETDNVHVFSTKWGKWLQKGNKVW